MVTTQRQLSIQRFTAAHELGHFYLEHKPSLDDENVLRRSPFQNRGLPDLQELEANTFAAAFLMPRWLVMQHCRQHKWTAADLLDPDNVYQLALRLGTSYKATCGSTPVEGCARLTGERAAGASPVEKKG